jgi:hypothetical protein
MAGPKPKHRDTPLSTTPETGNRQNYGKEPVRSLSLSRANQLENRTSSQISKDADQVTRNVEKVINKKYPYQGQVNTFTRDADKKDAINAKRESEFNRLNNWRNRAEGAVEKKEQKERARFSEKKDQETRLQTTGYDLEESMAKYKIPTKKKR